MSTVPSLPEALRLIRQRHAKTQAEFAEGLGLTHSMISKYESGRAVPSRTVLMLYLRMAEGVEKPAILGALDVRADLQQGWGAGELEAALQDFQTYLGAKRADQAKSKVTASIADFAREAAGVLRDGRGVDPSVVEIIRRWRQHGLNPKAREFFQHARDYLEVELTRLAASERKKPRGGN
jgi:transcriptional regulator with XRE-family HTH domain